MPRKTSKIRQSANGQMCQVRLEEICTHNPATVSLAHLGGAGIAMKSLDIHGAYACDACHAAVDLRMPSRFSSDILKLRLLEGIVRTQEILLKSGLMNFEGYSRKGDDER